MNFQEFKKAILQDPKIKKEFEKYDLAREVSLMLLEARIIKGVTQKKLAQMIKTKQSGIARAESGSALPSLTFLNKVAKAFHTRLIVHFEFMNNHEMVFENKANNTFDILETTISSNYISSNTIISYEA